MTATIERVTSHNADALAQALTSAGKRDLAKRAKAVYYQMWTYEVALRKAREAIAGLAGEKSDLLKPIDAALGVKE